MNIAVWDHSYHIKTRSTQFFSDYLQKLGSVDLLWDDSWQTGGSADLSALDLKPYDLIVFFQIVPPVEALDRLRCRSILLLPMYDSVGDVPLRDWVPYHRYAFVSFSEVTHRALTRVGVASYRLQYFPDPSTFEVGGMGLGKVFFWERSKDVSVALVRSWFSGCGALGFHHHFSPDPGAGGTDRGPLPDGWSSSTWFETKADYQAVVATCGIYVAPRKREGIGMSFLEAMARGMAVVGWNHATLSEYVIHGKTGLLLKEDSRIDPGTDWAELGRSARRSVEAGFLRYQEQLTELALWIGAFVAEPTKPRVTWDFLVAWADWRFHHLGSRLKRQVVRWKQKVFR